MIAIIGPSKRTIFKLRFLSFWAKITVAAQNIPYLGYMSKRVTEYFSKMLGFNVQLQ